MDKHPTLRPGTKIYRILTHLTVASLNTPEASRLGETDLSGTIFKLKKNYNVVATGEYETVPTRFGGEARFKRWRLSDEYKRKAIKLLKSAEKKKP